MKKYRVENIFMNEKQIKGKEEYNPQKNKGCYVGKYITALNEQNAIEIAIHYITEKVLYNTPFSTVRRIRNVLRFFTREGVEFERYFEFTATVVSEETYCVEHSKNDHLNEYFDDRDEALKKAKEIKERIASGEVEEENITVTYGIMRDGNYSTEETIFS